jgi:hypothetical protein
MDMIMRGWLLSQSAQIIVNYMGQQGTRFIEKVSLCFIND